MKDDELRKKFLSGEIKGEVVRIRDNDFGRVFKALAEATRDFDNEEMVSVCLTVITPEGIATHKAGVLDNKGFAMFMALIGNHMLLESGVTPDDFHQELKRCEDAMKFKH